MMYRTQLLQIMTAALKAANTLAGTNIYAPGDWPTDPQQGPAIQVGRQISENKISTVRGQPAFTTTAMITVDGRLAKTTGEDALTAIEILGDQIMQAILTSESLNRLLQQFSGVETAQEIDSSTGFHIAQITVRFALEFFESQEEFYMPVNPVAVEGIDVAVDSKNIFDPSGTYSGTPVTDNFPDAVVPAPRTEGPDGRTEGYIKVDLPQS